jgi:nucleotide-binding universal stress UspA family protein
MSTPQDQDRRRIVVGVDGSEPSKAALRWAICQAELTGSVVEAVTAWRYPPGSAVVPAPGRAADPQSAAEKTLIVALGEVSDLAPEVKVCPRVVQGPAAEMLVVGSRGHGGLAAALLGSVSQHCVQDAHCPVLVLHATSG